MATIGGQLSTPEAGWRRYDNTNPEFEYVGPVWVLLSNGDTIAFNEGNIHHDAGSTLEQKQNSYIKFTFYGTKIRLIAQSFTDRSANIEVTIDGVKEYYSMNGSAVPYRLNYEKLGLTLGFHSVEIRNKDAANRNMLWDAVDIDATGELKKPHKKMLFSSNNKFYSLSSAAISDKNSIPIMTSNTTPSGVASSSSEFSTTYSAWKAFNGTSTDVADCWATTNGITTGWIQYKFNTPKLIGKYKITSRNSTNRGDLKSWTFAGSNDGLNWTILDERTNEPMWFPMEEREYRIRNSKPFLIYRITISAVTLVNVSYITISELKMYETLSLKDTIVEFSEYNENKFINYGAEDIEFNSYLNKKSYINTSFIPLESGKTFAHVPNMSKRRVNRILLS